MKRPQISTTLDHVLFKEIYELARRERRSISEMVSILLRRAVNERNRKRSKPDSEADIIPI